METRGPPKWGPQYFMTPIPGLGSTVAPAPAWEQVFSNNSISILVEDGADGRRDFDNMAMELTIPASPDNAEFEVPIQLVNDMFNEAQEGYIARLSALSIPDQDMVLLDLTTRDTSLIFINDDDGMFPCCCCCCYCCCYFCCCHCFTIVASV